MSYDTEKLYQEAQNLHYAEAAQSILLRDLNKRAEEVFEKKLWLTKTYFYHKWYEDETKHELRYMPNKIIVHTEPYLEKRCMDHLNFFLIKENIIGHDQLMVRIFDDHDKVSLEEINKLEAYGKAHWNDNSFEVPK